ncbi:hypothetical protein PRK78_002176 [Emydomyces testavorans]|uniref:Uncharacterized protein n=1 Tax=Emydomyces testavorans TaxID=2070801 RepID=A0AAF0IHD4_9EURO|nr:hypothetical protein PRK78_002176 [Emydomyces testavorans]
MARRIGPRYQKRRNKKSSNPSVALGESALTALNTPKPVSKHQEGSGEGEDMEWVHHESHNAAGDQKDGEDGYFRGESHMNPEAAPFVSAGGLQGLREQQQHNPVSLPQEIQVPTVESIPFYAQYSFPSVYNRPQTPYPTAYFPYYSQPYYPLYSPCFAYIPTSWSTLPCWGPCCYTSMSDPAGNNQKRQHWAYAPPTQELRPVAMNRAMPVPAPVQGPTNRPIFAPFVVNRTRPSQIGGLQPPIAPPARIQPLHQASELPKDAKQVPSQGNASQGSTAPKQQEYKGPFIVPPVIKPASIVPSVNTHSTVSQTESHKTTERVKEQTQQQGPVASVTRQMAATSLTNTNSIAVVEVNNISVTNNTILVQGKPFEIPIDDGVRYSIPPKGGVLKLMNIPYGISKQEVVHLMGRKAKLLPQHLGTPVHIIMDRSTAKTMDCYVEFFSTEDAKQTLEWLNRGLPGAPPRLGDRHIDVEMSSQDELLKDLFPRAKCIVWQNGKPILTPNNDAYSVGFQGFLTGEETFCMIRNAEMPKRAPFASKCPQRTYEALISTLYKFPWHATTLYTVEQRNSLYYACYRQLQALVPRVAEQKTLGLDRRLLLDLLNAGLRCPTFNDRQKAALHIAANDMNAYKNTPETLKYWPFDILIRKPSASIEAVNKFASLVAASAGRKKFGTEILRNNWKSSPGITSPFGHIWFEFTPAHTHLQWNMAVQYEIKILQGIVEEGLKAIGNAPQQRTPRVSLAPPAAGNNAANRPFGVSSSCSAGTPQIGNRGLRRHT